MRNKNFKNLFNLLVGCALILAAVLLNGCGGAMNSNVVNTNNKVTPTPTPIDKSEVMPEFPFPPNASAEYEVDLAWLKNPNGTTTLADVNKKLRNALRTNGYLNLGYYSVQSNNGGFVITTSLEQFLADGKPLAGANRFTKTPTAPSIFSIYYWANVIGGNKGRYRLIAFMITDKLYEVNRSEPDIETAENLAMGGFNDLPPDMRSIPLTDNHTCTALIYEFRKERADGKVVFIRNSDVNAEAHLQNLLKTLREAN